MSNVRLAGDVSGTGSITIAAPNTNSDYTLTLPTVSGTLATAETAGFPSGTVMLFVQTAAPTGWTKSTTHDNKALRVVSGTASSGGSVAFTTAFASGLSAGATTLTLAQIPSHTHNANWSTSGAQGTNTGNFVTGSGFGGSASGYIASSGGGGSHDHTLPSFAVQYVDVIIATKN